jgi:16S rRNA (adenine1518-N6/adenine1519-N6)-dimethyltransferase
MRVKPKKSLGQNFLSDPNIKRKIIAACGLKTADIVLEIGPGQGAITGLLAQSCACVWAVEIDKTLCAILRDIYKDSPQIKIINADILKFDFGLLQKEIGNNKIKVFGNIPYYITSPIIEFLFKNQQYISQIFLTVQKEFAQRIIAKPGSKTYGSFSCFAQYYSEPKILFSIKKGSFYPVPKVDSCFLELNIRNSPIVEVDNEEFFFKIIRTAFGQRRKTLKNSLSEIISLEKLSKFFIEFSIKPTVRPEQLSLQDFANLAAVIPTKSF